MKMRYSVLWQFLQHNLLLLVSYHTTSVKSFLFIPPHNANHNHRYANHVQSEGTIKILLLQQHNNKIKQGRNEQIVMNDSNTNNDNANNNDNDDLKQYLSEFKLFITQRCIQSFMFLLAETRDLHTVNWLDSFIQPMMHEDESTNDNDNTNNENKVSKSSILLFYHGLSDNVFNTTIFGDYIDNQWDNFFWLLLEQPIDVIHVETQYARVVPDYDLEIHPARLCTRILSVREQICKEFHKDLDSIIPMSQHILDSYWENVNKERLSSSSSSSSQSTPSKSFDRQGLTFLEWDVIADAEGFAPSPLRQANFDLLNLLITKVAIQQILNSNPNNLFSENQLSSENNSMYKDYLYTFYNKNYDKYFEGNVAYGNAENFLEELMMSSPVINEEYNVVISPLEVVEVILQKRNDIVNVWKEHVHDIGKEHFEIRKVQLEKLMESY